MTTPREDRRGLLRAALLRIEDLEQQLARRERAGQTPIAIIGLACRFPGGADDPEAFWRILRDGVDTISEVPADRWDVAAFYDPDPEAPGKMSSRFGGFLGDVSRFDADFFGIAPREALKMDPQHRLLLEVAWEALENAGEPPPRLEGSRTGVFLGITANDYLPRLNQVHERIDAYHLTGGCLNFAAGRLSYLLGLQGPTLAVDTACSSSLVSVHLACQSLRSAECRMALAAGVNLILSPEVTIAASKARMLAPDGRCKTFDARADGFVRGEGCGVLVLKRLADAVADGDRVLAVIRASAVNQDGKSSGLTVPNRLAQEAVIREALAAAGVAPADVGYVEAHGTGTSLGDPIEVRALGAVLGEGRAKDRPFLLGSVKTNIGHLESAAGVAGLIKVVLALQNEAVPPHLHLQKPSPFIEWDRIPVRIPTTLTPWTRGGGRRIGGVSSFGGSGTNAHVVVEEGPAERPSPPEAERPLHILPVSARSEAALRALAGRLERRLAGTDAPPLGDVGFTLGTGRCHFPERAALVARSGEEARTALRSLAEGTPVGGVAVRGRWSGRARPEVAFLYTGQGSQYVGMGRELYETQPTFRGALDRCAELLGPRLGKPLLEVMFGAEGSLLDETVYTQPALFALEWSLTQLWRSWGIEPAVVMGHSAGEYAAACVAGVMGLEEGLRLIAERGRLMQGLPRDGAMVSLLASEERVRAAIAAHGGEVSIGAVNGPESVVISGRREAVEEVARGLEGLGVKTKALSVSHASHSVLMEPMLDEFERVAAGIRYEAPRLGLVSNVTGRLLKAGEIDAGYWRRHVREGVEFRAGMQTLREQGCEVFVEVGPSPVLLGMGQLCVPEGWGTWLPTLRRERGAWEQALTSLGELWVRGVEVDWSGFDRDYPRRKLALPTYPFERQRYWIEAAEAPAPEATPADPASVWERAEAAGTQQAAQAPLDLSISSYGAKWQSLNRLAVAFMVRTLRSLGAFVRAGERAHVESLLASRGVLPTYRHLVRRWLEALAADGLLARDGAAYASPAGLPEAGLEAAWAEARRELADLPFLIDYLARCGDKLPAVLTGAENPLETLFPGGSFETADHLYNRWAMVRYFNGVLGAVAESVARSFGPGRPLRVLEVGAGTGGTTAAVVPRLPSASTRYAFTDTSDVFLARAAERFAAHPFLSYGILDIERDPREQGFALQACDVVIAANVLHATRDLRETLDHVLSLLAPGGLLLLFETTDHPRWFDVSFGLIEGWQRFADARRRDNPLLGPDDWTNLLRAAGFEAMTVFPGPGSLAEVLIARVFMAQAPVRESAPSNVGTRGGERPATLRSTPPSPAEDVREALARAPSAERHERLVEYVAREVARVLRLPGGEMPGRRHRLMDLGFDSLMAVEFRNRLQKSLQLEGLPATLVFDYPTVDAIAVFLGKALALPSPEEQAPGPPPQAGTASTELAARVDALSEQEAEALLLKRLEKLGKR